MNGRPVTAEERTNIANEYVAGSSIERLAYKFHRSPQLVRQTILAQGLSTRRPGSGGQRKIGADRQDEMAREYQDGATLEILAEKYGCSPGTVRNVLTDHGVEMRAGGPRPRPISTTKICTSCGHEFPREQFYGNGKRTSECPECRSEKDGDEYRGDPTYRKARIDQAKAWAKAHPAETKARQRLWTTGWTQEQFDAAWEAQQGLCALCNRPMKREGRKSMDSVCADHDHETGQRRGLLHIRCNLLLGIHEKHRVEFEAYLCKHRKTE